MKMKDNFTIHELIDERLKYPAGKKIGNTGDALLDQVLQAGGDDEFIILYASSLNSRKCISAIKDKYGVVGVCGLGRIFPGLIQPAYLVRITKNFDYIKKLKMSIYNGVCFDTRDEAKPNHFGEYTVPKKFADEWEKYCVDIILWLIGGSEGVKPKDDHINEYNTPKLNQIDEYCLIPEHYSKEIMDIKAMLKEQATMSLSDVADSIFKPSRMKTDDQVKVITTADFKYPFDEGKVRYGNKTNYVVHNKDILINRNGKAYLFVGKGEEEIYVSDALTVIRCRDILPEYLCLYLNSNTAIKVLNSKASAMHWGISFEDLKSLPVIIPKESDGSYKSLFLNGITHERNYDGWQDILKNNEPIQNVETLLRLELGKKAKLHYNEELRRILSEDMEELRICYRHGAYKAAVIMAGSILEAFLLDWLSEIRNEPTVNDTKEDKLYEYIGSLEKDENAHFWIRRSDDGKEDSLTGRAKKIRESRNMVHVKLVLKKGVGIDRAICEEIIEALEVIIARRE